MCSCPADEPDVCPDVASGNSACTSKQSAADNCGACGMLCGPGVTCSSGKCGEAPTQLVMSPDCGSMRLALAGANLYFAERGSGKVQTLPVGGGNVVTVAALQHKLTEIAVDTSAVYWLTAGDGTAGSSKIWKKALPLAAGEPALLKAAPGTADIRAIEVRAGKLYYAVGHDVHAMSSESGLNDAIVGTATNLDVNPPVGEPSGEPAGLAVDDALVFWTTASRQGVERDDVQPGTAGYVELGESQGSLLFQDIASDGSFAYWANEDQLMRAKNDTKGTTLVTKTLAFDAITAFAINQSDVYFAGQQGTVFKHSLVPPPKPDDNASVVPPRALARDQLDVSSIVLDDAHVYWASGCALRVSKL